MSDSSVAGFLPLSETPSRTSVEDVLHGLICGITGFAGELVRSRWQPEPPRAPKPEVNWCAFGVMEFEPQNFPEILHHGEGEGHDEIIDHEILRVLVSFYGPGHTDVARHMRRGIHVGQNRASLRSAGLSFLKAGAIRVLPELVALQWQPRSDLPLTFDLETRCTYAALNLKKSTGTIEADHGPAPDGLIVSIGCDGSPT
jgi:hypothetical protein